jgi:tetratricopeptide (TPR) repeat protein
MASYQRRGYKKSVKAVESNEEVVDQNSQTAEVFSALDSGASRSEEWFRKNQKIILGLIIAIAVVGIGSFAYNEFIITPKEREAANELYYPQSYFEQSTQPGVAKDSLLGLALNGAQGKYGFVDIIDNYSGTKAAKLASYGAGMSYLQLGKYTEAIVALEGFSSDDAILSALAKGAIADAYAGLERYSDALAAYESAMNQNTNDFTTPMFLRKALFMALEVNETGKALKYARRLKKEYTGNTEASGIDAIIGNLE